MRRRAVPAAAAPALALALLPSCPLPGAEAWAAAPPAARTISSVVAPRSFNNLPRWELAPRTRPPLLRRGHRGHQSTSDDSDSTTADAERLRAQAARIREEAARMESALALEQIARLEERLEKAAASATASAAGSGDDGGGGSAESRRRTDGATSAGGEDADAVREQLRRMQRRVKREVDLQKLLAADGSGSRAPAFCSAAVEALTPTPLSFPLPNADAEAHAARLVEEAERAGLGEREAAELLANVVTCLVTERVDDALVEASIGNSGPAVDSVDGIVDLMDYASFLLVPFLAESVNIRPVVYEGRADARKVEALYATYALSEDADPRKVNIVRELFELTEERAEDLVAKERMEDRLQTMQGDKNATAEETANAIELQALIDDFRTSLQDFEESVTTEEDADAIDQVKQVAGAIGDVAELLNEVMEEDEELKGLKKEFGDSFKLEEILEEDELGALNEFMGNTTDDKNEFMSELVRESGGIIRGLKKTFNFDVVEALQGVKEAIKEGKEIDKLSKDDPSVTQNVEQYMEIFPVEFIDASRRPKQEYVDQFISLLQNDTSVYELSSKPQNIYYAYLVQGTNKLDSGDALIARLQEMVQKAGLRDKIRLFLVRFPNNAGDDVAEADAIGSAMEETEDPSGFVSAVTDVLAPPVLVVTGPVVTPEVAKPWEIAKSNALGLASVSYFVVSCFVMDGSGFSADWGYLSMLFVSILGLQLLHELGHTIAASIHGVRLSFPTIYPWPWTALLGTKTQLLSPPRNANALFDVAAAGPIVGMLGSITSLVAGLKAELVMDQSTLLELPKLPLETLEKTSLLTSSIIQSVAGLDVLASLDPTSSSIPCHPLVIAGYIGIVVNGLSFLPLSGKLSDGYRMCRAAGGPLGAAFFIVLSNIFLLIQGFREKDVSNLLLVYFFTSGLFLNGKEPPCLNDVDTAGSTRYAVFLATTLVVFVSLSPVL